MSSPAYDVIGVGYGSYRRADCRIARLLRRALGPARSVLNVGAGTGSYEPRGRTVLAIEPSPEMIRQRTRAAAGVVRGVAEHLPFRDAAVDAAMAVLTIHHWTDWRAGLAEMRRVARDRAVVLTWDPDHPGFWLTQEYFPEILRHDRATFPSLREVAGCLGAKESRTVPIPHDCTDGFLGAYWRRPERYLDPGVRAAMSTFSRLTDVETRFEHLARSLASGAWRARHGTLLEQQAVDLGYRILIGAPQG